MPVLAATIAFVTYTTTAHNFDVAIIFASLSLFQLLRQPLMFLPRALSATTDAQNALLRLAKVFNAEMADPAAAVVADPAQKLALDVRGATFEWEESIAAGDALGGPVPKGAAAGAKAKEAAAAAGKEPVAAGPPFQVKDITMGVARGTLVAIVGSVGR